ncbi:sirohydrochlorin ferrochelatase [Kitasatospora sp. SolWspMP-SS2h]|uniref:sirohydrochlorin chelatase n=1 Tax=Kitasatospora sp. SolWspMP-SS2h TaxID=1305729 RepID=UPI000DB95A07|nr:sirohydrochlorin chelatase [Kitasatospora sp. SolWspMP-SS2h]RAJ42654.1 sirohydrochlorin ferrochelatase [Kitasatospora sp. SolWspMP-SS2h]
MTTTPLSGRTAPLRVLHAARRPALVLVAHGSHDPAASAELGRLHARLRRARPELDIRLGHLGLNDPLLPEVLDELSGRVVLVPLLLSRGYHSKTDIPRVLSAAPHLAGECAPPLGPDPLLTAALADRLASAGWRGEPVVLAASGSRDQDAARDTETQAGLLADHLGVTVRPGYVAAGGPSVAARVAELTAEGHPRVAVASYFTAPGDFARLAAAASGALTSAPLGDHPALARLVLERYQSCVSRPLLLVG